MDSYLNIKQLIDDTIKVNKNQEITGPILNSVLTTILSTIFDGGMITDIYLNGAELLITDNRVDINAVTSISVPTGLVTDSLSPDGKININLATGYVIPKNNLKIFGASWDGLNDVNGDATVTGKLKANTFIVPSSVPENLNAGEYALYIGNTGFDAVSTGGSGTSVVWGSSQHSGYALLNVAGDSRDVAIFGHRHSVADISDIDTWINGKGYQTAINVSEAIESRLANYTTSQDVLDAIKQGLTGYATQDWVESKKYQNANDVAKAIAQGLTGYATQDWVTNEATAYNASRLGSRVASDYYHKGNANLSTVNWTANKLKSNTLIIPSAAPSGLSDGEYAMYIGDTGFDAVAEGIAGSSVIWNESQYAGYASLNVSGESKDVALYGHTHSQYLTIANATTLLSNKADLIDGKVPVSQLPDFMLGQMLYGGTINGSSVATLSTAFKDRYGLSASTLTISTSNASAYEGVYFIASANGASGIVSTLGVKTGDWVVSNGSAWTKIDNTDAVTSVVGQTGAITATQIISAIGVPTVSQPSGMFTYPEKTKLSGIAAGAQVNIIESIKLNGVALDISDKTVNIDAYSKTDADGRYVLKSTYTASDVLSKLLTVDGSGSGLDADLLDGVHLTDIFRANILPYKDLDANELTDSFVLYTTKSDIGGKDIGYVNFPNSKPSGSFFLLTFKEGAYKKQIYGDYGNNHLHVRSTYYLGGSQVFKDWSKIAFTDDNVASATKLATARTLWGQSFDGTANVSGDMKGVGAIIASGPIRTYSINIECDDTGALGGYDGEINRTDNSALYIQHRGGNVVMCAQGGNVGIGIYNAAYKLDVLGTARVSSTFRSGTLVIPTAEPSGLNAREYAIYIGSTGFDAVATGVGGSNVIWDESTHSNYALLNVEGITKDVALHGHTHMKSQISDFPVTWAWSAISNKPTATDSILGLVKVAASRTSAIATSQGGSTSGRYYGIEIDSNGKLFVNVPWTNVNYYISTEGDNRSKNTTPDDYDSAFAFRGIKYNNIIGISGQGTYSYLLGLRGWSDKSGGNSWELAFNDGGIYARSGATDWGAWSRILTEANYTGTLDERYIKDGENVGTAYIRGLRVNGTSWNVLSNINSDITAFYAPQTPGSSGQILQSTAGTPTWVNPSSIATGFLYLNPNNGTHASQNDAVPANGRFAIYDVNMATTAGGNDGYIMAFRWPSGNFATQVFLDVDSTGIMALRHRNSSSVWTDWYRILHSGNYSSYLDSRYVKKSGDSMTGLLTISRTSTGRMIDLDSNNSELYVRFLIGSSYKGSCGYNSTHGTFLYNASGRYFGLRDDGSVMDSAGNKYWHSGNVGEGSGMDADLLDGKHGEWYQNNGLKFNRTAGTSTAGGYDANELIGKGGIMVNMSSHAHWANTPEGLQVGAVFHIEAYNYTAGAAQFAWDTNANSTTVPTRNLWFRAANNVGFANDWHQIAFTDDNVASATKLQTAHTLWGRSFDGTENVSGAISSTGSITPSAGGSYNIGTSSLWYERIYGRYIDTASGYNLRLCTGGVEHLSIQASTGNVGVNNTSPSYKFDVAGTFRATGAAVVDSLTITTTGTEPLKFSRPSYNYFKAVSQGGAFAFETNAKSGIDNAELIIADGYVYSGTTDTVYLGASTYRWAGVYGVVGNFSGLVTASSGVQIGNTSDYGWYLSNSRLTAGINVARGVNVGSLLISSAWADYTKVPTNGIYCKGNILTGGTVTANGNVIAYSSSSRQLKDIVPHTSYQQKLQALGRVVDYRYNNILKRDKELHTGLIYENVKVIMPSMCYMHEGYGALNYLSTDYINLIAGAVQEHTDEITELKRKIMELESEIAKLRRAA